MFTRGLVSLFFLLLPNLVLADASGLSRIQDQILNKNWKSAQSGLIDILTRPDTPEIMKESAYSLHQILPAKYRCDTTGPHERLPEIRFRVINYMKNNQPKFLLRLEFIEAVAANLKASVGERRLPLIPTKTQAPEVKSSFESIEQVGFVGVQVVTIKFAISDQLITLKFPWRFEVNPKGLPDIVLPLDGGKYTNEKLEAVLKREPTRHKEQSSNLSLATAITPEKQEGKVLYESQIDLSAAEARRKSVYRITPTEESGFHPLAGGSYVWNFQFVRNDLLGCVSSYDEWLSSREFKIKKLD